MDEFNGGRNRTTVKEAFTEEEDEHEKSLDDEEEEDDDDDDDDEEEEEEEENVDNFEGKKGGLDEQHPEKGMLELGEKGEGMDIEEDRSRPINPESSDESDEEMKHVLTMDGLNRHVWLVKIPQFLNDQWKQCSKEGTELGTVQVQTFPDNNTKVSLVLSNHDMNHDLPKEYSLNFIPVSLPMNVFSENEEGQVSMEGSIEHECHMNPVFNDDYRKIMRGRMMESTTPKRSLQVLDENKTGSLKAGFMAPISEPLEKRRLLTLGKGNMEIEQSSQPQQQPIIRKERLPKDQVLDMVFGAFGKYMFWTLRGMVEYTNQPTSWVRDILAEVAVYNKRGPHKSLYELKSEYRQRKPDSDEPGPSGPMPS